MNFAKDLLFLHGHIIDPRSLDTTPAQAGHASPDMAVPAAVPPDTVPRAATTVRQAGATAAWAAPDRLAPALRRLAAPARFFNGLLPLAALSPLASRTGSGQSVFGPTYGNRIASRRVFGGSSPWPGAAGCLTGACG